MMATGCSDWFAFGLDTERKKSANFEPEEKFKGVRTEWHCSA
jgi:hypothetical protein